MSSDLTLSATAALGDIDPCGSRQAGRRSGVTLDGDGPVVGRADGTVAAFTHDGTERWTVDGTGSAVTLVSTGDGVLVGERSERGRIQCRSRNGKRRWQHDAADDVGGPTKDTRFFLPMVVDAAVGSDGTCFVAARRYERRNGGRGFESSVYAFARDGTLRWRYDADASPIGVAPLDEGDGVAVAYNRCPGGHDSGLVVLDDNGSERWTWDPKPGADRRVGDVAVADGSVVVTSHADYRGYRLTDGSVEWAVDLGRPQSDGGVYTYPNHVHATASGAVFLTGNTFPQEGRETDERHENEQTAFGYTPDGKRRWQAAVGGFAHEVGTDGERMLVPTAQHFRDCDPTVHGWTLFDVADGPVAAASTDGVVTAAAVDGERGAVVEEPVRYHVDETLRGEYSLRMLS
ncbi:PQQ repeat protein [Natronomonas pharaonis DSM 2160]|uniref:PQQ repeat protein n=1 Tax=Natronomonas pharaonis (strain ATCC 35678 / DSM 2160 / CIP 103997 / JCM 8858 / NBRC 14720 / NCIMB 2260 / Gabara) TaxID=348780 RepID=A0A1U7EUI8_NATPD|nr:PQQ-binding-like beta-propeller repeat protein [Natronomonas pharaonis]CAI48643.1 PQQ repeat protein [Natronomonas pharaonis DSM 2160]